MLSYRHAFHAGNFADLIKHIVQVEILEHLCKKSAPFEYIDTHSGVGMYNLNDPSAQKNAEYKDGIAKLSVDTFPELKSYFDVIRHFNTSDNLTYYPGSPAIAQYFLRDADRGWMYELHPQDYPLLRNNMQDSKRIKVSQQDGYQGLDALLPPKSRRGLILIDPSYEVKTEYEQVVKSLIKAHKKFSTGTYALWYPVVSRQDIGRLQNRLIHSGIKNIQQFELALKPDTNERGMTAAGMIVINPPWTLLNTMTQLLPKLAKQLGADHENAVVCKTLVEE